MFTHTHTHTHSALCAFSTFVMKIFVSPLVIASASVSHGAICISVYVLITECFSHPLGVFRLHDWQTRAGVPGVEQKDSSSETAPLAF